MTAETVLESVRRAGGQLWADGEKIKYRIPAERSDLIDALREFKGDILGLFSEYPAMPPGVRLVRWEPKTAPVRLSGGSTVTDVGIFIRSTLRQLDARLNGKHWQAGNWTLSTLLERLAAVGCFVELHNPKAALQ